VSFDISQVRRSRAQAAAEALAAPLRDWRRFLPHYALLSAAALAWARAARPGVFVALALAIALLERPWSWSVAAGLFERRWLGPLLEAVSASALSWLLAFAALRSGFLTDRRRRLAAFLLLAAGLAALWP
jgi:hypothetical protein